MSSKNNRAPKPLEQLADQGYQSVHLLFALGDDIAEPDAAATCIAHGNALPRALLSVLDSYPRLGVDPSGSHSFAGQA